MRGRDSRLVRDLALLFGGELASKLVGVVAFAWLARALEPRAYGAVELAVSLSLFFALIVDFGLGPIGAREVARDPGRAGGLAARIPAARLLLALAAIPLMAGAPLVMGQPPATARLVWLFAAALLAVPWHLRWLLQGLEMMGWVSAGQAVRMGVFALGVVVFVRAPGDLLKVGAVEIAAAAAAAVYFLAVQQRRIAPLRLALDGAALRRLLGRALPIGASQVVWAVNQYLPILLLAALVGGEAIAWFGAAHRIVISLGAFAWIYHFNLFPALARRLAESPESLVGLVRPSTRVVAWAGVGVALVGTLVAEPACRLVYGGAFQAAGAPLALLVWMLPATLLQGHARSALVAQDQQRFLLVAHAAGAAATLAAGLVLIPGLGAPGAAGAMLISQLVVWAVVHRYAVRLVAPIPGVAAAARPAALALAAALLASGLAASPWLAAALAAGGFAAGAPLVDRALLGDLRRLMAAKADAPPAPVDPA